MDAQIGRRQTKSYLAAAEALGLLRELSERADDVVGFELGLHEIYKAHGRKTNLIALLKKRGLEDPGAA